jgi:hypothetical protein
MSFQRVFEAQGNRSQGRLMEDAIDPAKRRLHGRIVANISLDQFDVSGDLSQVAAMAGRKIIQDPHAVARFEQTTRNVRADKTRPAGHQAKRHEVAILLTA